MPTTIRRAPVRRDILPLLALRGLAIFPGVQMHFDVGRKRSVAALNEAMGMNQTIFLVTQKNGEDEVPALDALHPVGVVASVTQILRLPGDVLRVAVEGRYRAKITDVVQDEDYPLVSVREYPDRPVTEKLAAEALVRECRNGFSEYAALSPRMGNDVFSGMNRMKTLGALTDYIAFHMDLDESEKQALLSERIVEKRAHRLLKIIAKELAVLNLEQVIHERVQSQMDKNQKEYYLREQIKAIATELGDEDNPMQEADNYRTRILALQLPDEHQQALLKKCDSLAKMPFGSHEATVVREYLDTCLALPWNIHTEDNLDLDAAQKQLDRDHYGLEKVKERMLEALAARQLSGEMKGQVICLVGPPGTGKTSIARSVAKAMGRKYVRISLGGVRDEADIRGHRKTYIGAMPGRILAALRQAGSSNPLILLDEVDKLGNDFRGDPAAALLEVLDIEQNKAFCDHYVELPFDLSDVLFMTSANDESAIPAPLYDRMDVIRLTSYTAEEKFHIAKEHLLKKQRTRHGLTAQQLRISDDVLRRLIQGYTREAGVRELERTLAKICRKTAKKLVSKECRSVTVRNLEDMLGPVKYKPDAIEGEAEVGLANGLAWTSVGGESLPVEVAVLDGTGKLELTGSLGNVMKESAQAAVSYVRAHAGEWNIDGEFYKNKDIHIHVPEGAVPKDGPSAGVTLITALVSALSGIPVRQDVAMTGEITLRGRVLPIGGLREKTMAAYIKGFKTVILPEENASDLAEIDQTVCSGLQFVTAKKVDTVLKTALTNGAESAKSRKKDKASRPHPVATAVTKTSQPLA